jgi:tetratricopeptide (TPR) repeat protein
MNEQKRKRGVKASREKLEKAMLEKGMDSQIQLARQISINEGLERPPKELISKVFREQSVSHTNLARVAKALGVESHTLYMNSQSTPINLDSQQINIQAKNVDTLAELKRRSRPILALFMVSVLTILIYLVFQKAPEDLKQSTPKYQLYGYDPKLLNIGFYMSEELVSLSAIAESIRATLSESNEIHFTQAKSFDSGAKSIKEYFSHTQNSLLFRVESIKGQRYSIVLLYAETEQVNYPVAYQLVRSSLLPNKQQVGSFIAEQFVERIHKISHRGEITELVQVDALNYLLSGFDLLFDHTNNPAILGAQSRFQNAISIDPKLVEAHAGLCVALSYESYMNNAAVSFEQALKSCEKAKEIDATSEYSELAFAEYFLNKADADSAENSLLQNQYSPISIADELSLNAQISFQRHQDGLLVEEANIIEPAMQSIKYAPELWRSYNILGQYYLSKGETDKSLLILAQGAEASKHSVLLSNVGSLQLCQGNLDSAEMTYLNLIEQKPEHYIGYEMLGSVYYYQQQYDSALAYRKQALDKLPETNIHQLWGVIGLVYAKLNKLEEGKPYLLKAIELIDQDESMQIAGLSELISREYYEFVMSGLETENLDQKLVNNGVKDINSLQLTSRIHLSELLMALNRNEDAEVVKQSAASICPIFDRT